MDKKKKKTVVNSWNEWDPLKHIIVGRADGSCIPASEPALDAKVPEDSDMKGKYGPRPKETVDKANELLDNFVKILEKRGIVVDRQRQLILINQAQHQTGRPKQCLVACPQEMFS